MSRRLAWNAVPTSLMAAVALAAVSCESLRNDRALVASGHLEAVDVRIVTKVRGRLLSRPFDEGDRVKTGDVLAVLDTVDNGLFLRQAKADRDQADAGLRLRVEGSRKEDIAQLAAEVDATAADLDGADKELARQERLLVDGITTASDRDKALARRDVLRGQLAAARQALGRSRAGNRAQEIEAARAQLASMDARIAQLAQQIADATIVSPVDGVVTEKIAEPGELLAAGAAVLVVTDLSKPWLTVYVPEPALGRIKLGATAQVVTDGGEKREGKVTFIASKAEFTPKNVQTRDERVKLVYRVKIGLGNSDGLFKPGMPAEAHF